MLIVFALILISIGSALMYYGHRVGDDRVAVALTVNGGALVIGAVMWLGDLLGFLAGLDADKLIFIIKADILIVIIAEALIIAGAEELLSKFFPRPAK